MLCSVDITKHMKTIFEYSGHNFLRLGNFNGCRDLEGYKYNSVEFTTPENSDYPIAFIGLCLPESCTVNEIKTVVNKMLENTK